ncbi:hypothetical protein DBR23_00370, partial [Acidovorax sp. HMWF018]
MGHATRWRLCCLCGAADSPGAFAKGPSGTGKCCRYQRCRSVIQGQCASDLPASGPAARCAAADAAAGGRTAHGAIGVAGSDGVAWHCAVPAWSGLAARLGGNGRGVV